MILNMIILMFLIAETSFVVLYIQFVMIIKQSKSNMNILIIINLIVS